eukprot:COSAG01_NODE_14201_length_1483_cov_3.569364_1_plen_58_part_10
MHSLSCMYAGTLHVLAWRRVENLPPGLYGGIQHGSIALALLPQLNNSILRQTRSVALA